MPHETQQTINEWQRENFPNSTLAGVVRHLREEVGEFFEALQYATNDYAVVSEAADIVILLYAWADKVQIDLHKAIDSKMAINRARNWNIQPDGTGRHK